MEIQPELVNLLYIKEIFAEFSGCFQFIKMARLNEPPLLKHRILRIEHGVRDR